MSSEERKKILQMVQDGKISAEQAASLMRALDDDAQDGGRFARGDRPRAGQIGNEKCRAGAVLAMAGCAQIRIDRSAGDHGGIAR